MSECGGYHVAPHQARHVDGDGLCDDCAAELDNDIARAEFDR